MILLVIYNNKITYNNKIMCLMMNDVALFNTRKKFIFFVITYNNKIMCLMMNDVALFNTRKKFLYEQNFIDAD